MSIRIILSPQIRYSIIVQQLVALTANATSLGRAPILLSPSAFDSGPTRFYQVASGFVSFYSSINSFLSVLIFTLRAD